MHAELRALAEDIEDMRPFLVRAIRPERFILRLADDLFAAPLWVLLQGHIALVLADSERDLLEGLRRQYYKFQLLIGFDGLLCHPIFHWRTSADLPVPALAANLTIVRAVHSQLMDAFARVDLARMLREPSPPDEEPIEALARANVLLAAEDDGAEDDGADDEVDSATVDSRPKTATTRLSPRWRRLATQLVREFDCEIRSGKGSEISIYRAGGRIFTLGHHKRNPRIRWPHVRQMLRTLGISEDDWVRSVASRE